MAARGRHSTDSADPSARRTAGSGLRRGARRAVEGAGSAYRTVVVRGAWPIVAFWVVAAAVLTVVLSGTAASTGSLGGLLPPNSRAVQLELLALQKFAIPILSETTVVVHDPNGLSPLTKADVLFYALAIDQASGNGEIPLTKGHIIGAVPVPTSTDDTLATYLYISGGTSYKQVQQLAEQYGSHFHNDPRVQTYVTGVTPAQLAQGNYLVARIGVFAVVSLLLIGVIVGLAFGSITVPVTVLAIAGLAYVVVNPLLTLAANTFGFPLPEQIQPLVVALLLGVVTDYCVLFFNRFRTELARSGNRHDAARVTMKHESSVVAVAGLTVTGGLLALLAANLQLFRSFGPSLALTVFLSLLVSLTLTPAVMVVLGHRLFHPVAGARRSAVRDPHADDRPSRVMAQVLRIVLVRSRAAALLVGGVVVLGALAAPAAGMRFDLSFTSGLPASDPVQQGAAVLDRSGIRGVTAPIEILVYEPNIASRQEQLSRFQAFVASEPHVSQVFGPAQNPLPRKFGVVFSEDGNYARLLAILDTDPLAAGGVAAFQRLQSDLPRLAALADLPDASIEATGQTAIAAELSELTKHNLRITLLVAVAVQFILLLVYLRALLAPLALLLGSILGVAATLGLTVLMFQDLRGDPGLTFYVPFATAVLLLSLGSDYNVFSVGSIWDEARRRPLADALRVAVPRSSRAVTSAGLILAATFAATAIIELESFREIAFTMSVGLLIDTLIVRPLLTPAVLTVLGRAASWPTHRVRTAPDPAHLPDRPAADAAAREGPRNVGTR